MSFKDIDYRKLIRDREQGLQLKKKIAVINKLNDWTLSPTMRLATAELISGKTLQPKSDPMKELVHQQEAANNMAPVLREIEEVKKELPAQTAVLDDQHLALAQPNIIPAIKGAPTAQDASREGVDLYDRFNFTEDELEYYKDNNFADLNVLATANDQNDFQEILGVLNKLCKKLSSANSGINKRKHSRTYDVSRIQEIVQEMGYIRRYRSVVKKLQTGKGLVVGSYQIPLRRLARDNIASVRYAKNPKKIVPGFGVHWVSNDVKHVLLGKAVGNLSASEKAWLDKLFTSDSHWLGGVYTGIAEIVERVKVLLGEIEAGNTSIELWNELSSALHYLYKHKKITKADYRY